jgi:hypothetical protein
VKEKPVMVPESALEPESVPEQAPVKAQEPVQEMAKYPEQVLVTESEPVHPVRYKDHVAHSPDELFVQKLTLPGYE